MRWIYGRCSSILPTSLYWPYQGLVNRDTCSSGHFSHELRGCSTSGQKHHRNLSGSISGLFAQDQTKWSKNGTALHCQLLSPGPHIPRAPHEATALLHHPAQGKELIVVVRITPGSPMKNWTHSSMQWGLKSWSPSRALGISSTDMWPSRSLGWQNCLFGITSCTVAGTYLKGK